jgi:hypothetical protein
MPFAKPLSASVNVVPLTSKTFNRWCWRLLHCRKTKEKMAHRVNGRRRNRRRTILAHGGYGLNRTPGKLFLSEHFDTRENAIANIAHEFGHVCTRFEDLQRRGERINAEWTSELAADWYACKKWGFGKEVARSRKNRAFLHHGPKPRDVFQFGEGHYQVTRNFCIRRE